ncbi:hypothetical protein BGW80DRAFT_1405578, partial [Lactifluus volemus]
MKAPMSFSTMSQYLKVVRLPFNAGLYSPNLSHRRFDRRVHRRGSGCRRSRRCRNIEPGALIYGTDRLSFHGIFPFPPLFPLLFTPCTEAKPDIFGPWINSIFYITQSLLRVACHGVLALFVQLIAWLVSTLASCDHIICVWYAATVECIVVLCACRSIYFLLL